MRKGRKRELTRPTSMGALLDNFLSLVNQEAIIRARRLLTVQAAAGSDLAENAFNGDGPA
jgi:hypothetical protein